MKTINLAKQYGFKTEYEIYDYLIDSYINGNLTQCKAIMKKLTKDARLEFMEYLKEFSNSEMKDKFIKIIIEL